MNTSTFHPTSVWLTNVIMKKQYYKTCQIKKNSTKELEYNITSTIWYVQASSFAYYKYRYRQKAKKLKTAAEETMACANYSPQVHKLWTLCSEQKLLRSQANPVPTRTDGKFTSCEGMGMFFFVFVFRRVSLWKPGEEDSLIIRGTYFWGRRREKTLLITDGDYWLTEQLLISNHD